MATRRVSEKQKDGSLERLLEVGGGGWADRVMLEMKCKR